jgi:hypothetical protein
MAEEAEVVRCWCGAAVDRRFGATRSGDATTLLACSVRHAADVAKRVRGGRVWAGGSLSPEVQTPQFETWMNEKG